MNSRYEFIPGKKKDEKPIQFIPHIQNPKKNTLLDKREEPNLHENYRKLKEIPK